MAFDLAAFKAKWRESCRKRGVDPECGATSYQVAAYKAELAEAEKRNRVHAWATAENLRLVKRWPKTAPAWFDTPMSDVESAAMARLAGEIAARIQNPTPHEFVMDVWLEVRRELRQEMTARERETWVMPKVAFELT